MEKNRQIFQPIKIWTGIQLVTVVPGTLAVVADPLLLHPDVSAILNDDITSAISRMLVAYTTCNFAALVSYYLVIGKYAKYSYIAIKPVRYTPHDNFTSYLVVLSGAIFLYLLKLYYSGGIIFVIDNISNRTAIQRGLGPINYLSEVTFLLVVIIATRRHHFNNSILNTIIFATTTAFVVIASSAYGGRKFALQLLIATLMIKSLLNHNVLPMKTSSFLYVALLYIFVFLYFFIVLSYRQSDDILYSNYNTFNLLNAALDNFANLLVSMSYLDNYIFITNYYNDSNYLYGATFRDLPYGFLPSALVPDKPPADEGLYVRFATLGIQLQPGTPAKMLEGIASWPPETLGAAYMNGGMIAVPLSGALLGSILGAGVKKAIKNPNSLFWIVILINLILNFEISNLRIITIVSYAGATLVVLAVLKSIHAANY